MAIFLLVLFAIVCILLIFFVIIQNESGDSIGGLFAGTSDSAFGSRSSSIIVKITYGLGGAFLVLVFLLAFQFKSPSIEGVEKASGESIKGEGYNWIDDAPEAAAPVETLPAAEQPSTTELEATGVPTEGAATGTPAGTPATTPNP